MRKRSLFNEDWLFAPEQVNLDAPDASFEAITLPHPNKIFPHHNFDNLARRAASNRLVERHLIVLNENDITPARR